MVPQSRRVLIVEDDAATTRLLEVALKQRGLEVSIVNNGAEAIAALQHHRWDVLVSDLMMPDVDGRDVMSWVARHPEHRPSSVIIFSAADREILHRLDPSYVNAIIFKPFDIAQFARYVGGTARYGGRDRRRGRVVRLL